MPLNPGPVHTPGSAGLVAAAHPAAAQAGAGILRAGGNAIDATCAAAWALGVCEPAESGLGGQTTMLVRFPDGRCTVLDGHSRAPGGLSRTLVRPRDQHRGIRSCTIPSTPATLGAAQALWGRLTLREALEPSIRLAEEGYALTRLQRRLISWTAGSWAPGGLEAATFLNPDGSPRSVGSVIRQPTLGATLRRLARHGVEDFYRGEMAREITSHMQATGGLVTLADLTSLDLPVQREALCGTYRGHRVLSVPPPGGGVHVLLALAVLERLIPEPGPEAQWRLGVARAVRAAFEARERWPDHPDDMNPSLLAWMTCPERASEVAGRLSGTRQKSSPPTADVGVAERGDTTHLVAIDASGMVVSLTQTIQSVFGSKVMHPTLGFFYNNSLTTCPRRSHPYRLRAGALPQSNAAPTLVLDGAGRPRLALGAAGSRRITSAIVQIVSAVIDRGMPLGEAIGLPRVHPVSPRECWVEQGVPEEARALLAGHYGTLRPRPARSYKFGAAQGAEWVSGSVVGAADPRRDGSVALAET